MQAGLGLEFGKWPVMQGIDHERLRRGLGKGQNRHNFNVW